MQRARNSQVLYNLTPEQIAVKAKSQDGLCKVCGNKRPLHVDHDHVTGRVRDLLCGQCNRALGLLGENSQTIKALANYIHEWKLKE